jgi:hypothetical protein
MPLKKAVRSKTSPVARKSTRPAKTRRVMGNVGAAAMLIALLAVIGVAIVVASRDSSDPPEFTSTESRPEPVPAPASSRKASPVRALSDQVPEPAPTTGADEGKASDTEPGTSPASKTSPVTIAGCLERSDKAFRLKDATGVNVPKSRSWKSGFLKKGSATVDVVDAAKSAKLQSHVGQRVSVTGVLNGHEMQVRSLQRVSASCSAKS